MGDLENDASNLTAKAEAASAKAKRVGDKYDEAAAMLAAKAGSGGDAALDARELKQRADKLFQDTKFKLERLQVCCCCCCCCWGVYGVVRPARVLFSYLPFVSVFMCGCAFVVVPSFL